MPENKVTPVPPAIGRRRFLRVSGLGLGLVGAAGAGGLLTGCTADGAASAGYPERPIQVIIAYAPGGGTDVGARILQPFLEEELGAQIQIVNRPGGGGWAGWNEIVRAEPDGYTIGFINSPNFMTGYLDPRLGRTDVSVESFTPIANQVTDYGAIAVHPDDDRFSDIGELMAYAEKHPLIVTSTGVGSDDHYASLALSDRYRTRFSVLHNEGSSDGISDLLGRNADVVFANVGEVMSQHEDGKVKVVAVMRGGKERSPYLPDVPTMAEAGFEGVESWSSRGIAGPAGLDPTIVETLSTACRKAINNPEHIDQLGSQGLEVDYKAPDDYARMLKRDDKSTRRLGEKYIWGPEAV
ncbi:tripartite tricarboxylate transporter substrate binding protein [Streptomonospora nanhaiensis]|uniref:Tripartite-type tricarboxylate transporter receptor subunit TctC n=1 Tax=Streptomonospora nanhaiensis TaxID=1323731 RepID=A0A853BV57_9ACTN|nr:tripartite tricarboxylate transporter substrate binding protein [Streptomonospora nanhaiensis]MBV2365432.1 tripartite tricarboxylate transporter substrate binding protein [Streptomonospora nanhaiensis]MBX9387093.1 tripartite tricarboxylate transporter substrate binding protein [Streptomonospora nanhaiensis]NYI98973.1 tripartite-type tricarboxylate transporter receptor subunit TctC [Streptomonospora nanhaiensis]